MDGFIQPALPGVGVPDRSPLDMPEARARRVLQAAAVQIRALAAENAKRTGQPDMANSTWAEALENMAAGEPDAAWQAMQEAAMYRAMRA